MKKVLIIGHNVFDERTAFGKTLSSFFKNWDSNKLAQLYFHSEIPTSHICDNYYRITDKDAINSIVKPWSGMIGISFSASDVVDDGRNSRTDSGITNRLYSIGRKRTSRIYIARNAVWSLAHYKKNSFIGWLKKFSPDVIFFAAGDYAFAYKITSYVAELLNIPVVIYCCDDYYINRLNPDSVLSKCVYRDLMKAAYNVVRHSSSMLTICDKMTKAYSNLFDIPIDTLYTGYSKLGEKKHTGIGIVYLGNLGFSRYESLIDIGKTLLEINSEYNTNYYLDVYSSESREYILNHLTESNGIHFHGSVNSDEVNRIISECRIVIHTESFNENNIYKVQYSVSTKIADLLASGHCILAYGPESIASIEYLKENNAAIVVSDKRELKDKILQAINSEDLRETVIENAMNLAKKNHAPEVVKQTVQKVIESARRDV